MGMLVQLLSATRGSGPSSTRLVYFGDHTVLRTMSLAAVIGVLASVMVSAQNPPFPPEGGCKPAPTQTPQDAATGLRLTSGTKIHLELMEAVSSASAHPGDSPKFDVSEAVKVDDYMVVPKERPASATVISVVHKRSVWQGGMLTVCVNSVELANGEKIPVTAVVVGRGPFVESGFNLSDVPGIVIKVPVELVKSLFTNGLDTTVPKGYKTAAKVTEDVPLDVTKFPTSSVPAPAQP